MINCSICNKKVGLLSFTCKCGDKIFCTQHRMPELHNCLFDFKKEHKERLIKENPIIISDKIIRF
jgi:hypothetical protein